MEDLGFSGGGRGRASVSRRALGVGVVAASFALSASPALSLSPAPARASSHVKEDRTLVDAYAAVEGANLGVVLPGGPESFITLKESSQYSLRVHEYGKTFYAAAATDCAYNSSDTETIGCTITLYGAAHKRGNRYLRGTVAHEVFHVFETRMSGSRATMNAHEGWLVEGAANWVESDLVNPDPGVSVDWKDYLRSPQVPLFSRDYDAVGFFGHMESTKLSPWKHFDAMFKTTSSAAAYAAAGIGKTFLDDEASVFFREPKFGSEWDQQGPNVPSATQVGFKPTAVNVTTKGPSRLAVKPYADGAYDLTISSLPAAKPVLELTVVKGNVRLHSTSGGDVNELDPQQVLLCSDPKGCSCPSRPSHYLKFQRGDLAITGGSTGGDVQLAVRKPCEVLLPAVSCTTLLPGFGPLILSIGGKSTSTESRRPDGTVDSGCAWLYKGMESANAEGEEEFVGAIAPVINVLRATTVAGATRVFKLTSPSIAGFELSRPRGIGEEAVLYTRQGVSAKGQAEYASSAIVRVRNIVVNYSLLSTPGNTEADPANSLKLLAAVAHRL